MSITRFSLGASSATTTARFSRRAVAIAAVLATLVTGTILGTSQPAYAKDYPTWDDVAAARNNESAAKNQIAAIEAALVQLEADVKRTQEDAEKKGAIWGELDSKFQAAATRASNLLAQAEAADAAATQSEQRAGQMAAQLVRAGGGDVTANLLANAGNADSL